MTQALEEAIGLYLMPSGDDDDGAPEGAEEAVERQDTSGLYESADDDEAGTAEPAPRTMRLRILEMRLTIEPLLPPIGWDLSDEPMRQRSPREDPHQQWHLRGFHRRCEQ